MYQKFIQGGSEMVLQALGIILVLAVVMSVAAASETEVERTDP